MPTLPPSLVAARIRFVDNKAHGLALLDIVKPDDADVAVGILRSTFAHFVEHVLGRRSAKQRQFPQRPVVIGGVGIFLELDGGNKPLLEHIIDLTSNLLIGQGGQIGQSFVAFLFG